MNEHKWLANVAKSALCHPETLTATFDLACATIIRGVPGDFVECGVFGGAHCAAMALAIQGARENGFLDSSRRVHLFDSFRGMPQCGPEDHEFVAADKKPGESSCSIGQVKSNMLKWRIPEDLLVYHAGWFSETVPSHGIERIAMLRLDADLYESTRVCMEHLYSLVSRGGWVIVDDWNLSGARNAVEEVAGIKPCYFQRLP